MHYRLDKEKVSLFLIDDEFFCRKFVPRLGFLFGVFLSVLSQLFNVRMSNDQSTQFAFVNMIIDSAISGLCDPVAGHR